MTYDLESLQSNSFYLTYYAGIQPSEIDKLTTHEFKRYLDYTSEKKKEETESSGSVLKSLASMMSLGGLGLFKKGR